MEIIVNDTNIFIDLHSIGLLEALCDLPYDVRTVDFVIAEITNPEQSEDFNLFLIPGNPKPHQKGIVEAVISLKI